MRHLARFLLLGFVAVVWSASPAWADGEIRNVRTSANPQFDRLVFDLGPSPVDVASQDGDKYIVEFQASPPNLSFAVEDKLSSLGIKIERAGSSTRVTVDRRGRNVQVFRLAGSSASSSGRVILDVSKGGSALSVPADAQSIPQRSSAVASTPAPEPAAEGKTIVLGETPPAPTGTPIVLGETNDNRPAVSMAPPSGGSGGPEEVWVSVRAIDFEGVSSDAPSRDDLLNLELNVSVAENGDLVAPRTDLPVQTLTLRNLTSDERQKSRIGGSLLQQIVERIADEYEERGKYGTRIDISKRDLERLLKDQDGRLVIRISESSETGTGNNG